MKTNYILVLVFTIYINCVHPWGVSDISKIGRGIISTGSDITLSTVNTGRAVIKKIPDIIPTPDEIFSMGKEALGGLPFQIAFDALNELCSLSISGKGTTPRYTPKVEEMRFVLINNNENSSFPLLNPSLLWEHPGFNPYKNTTIFITGWLTDLNTIGDDTIDTVAQAYLTRGDYNFIVLDSARYIDTLYSWSAFNTEQIGEYVGKALALLIKTGYHYSKLHVIGNSLGAQISGSTGRAFTAETGYYLPRITGLDPANPCFNEGEVLSGLHRGDADFIDIIHTNNGALGQRQPIGDVDFYVNGVTALQPGCLTIICAHSRAWKLWAETVYPGNEENFKAIRCNSLFALGSKRCPGSPINMGLAVDKNAKGNFFLRTRGSSPFGENVKRF